MNIENQINEGIKGAMKNREKIRLETLRNVKKYIIEAKTSGTSNGEIGDDECIKIIQKLAKQGSDSAAIYTQQNRQDLADYELSQVDVLKEFLPEMLDDNALEAAIKDIIATSGVSSIKEMGKVMGLASKQLAGKADGKDIAAKVKLLLS